MTSTIARSPWRGKGHAHQCHHARRFGRGCAHSCPGGQDQFSTGVGLSLKGQMGLVLERGSMHSRYDLDTAIVDLCSRIKPDLAVVDATRVLSTNEPYGPGKVLHPIRGHSKPESRGSRRPDCCLLRVVWPQHCPSQGRTHSSRPRVASGAWTWRT